MRTLSLVFCAVLTLCVRAEQRLASFDWGELARAGTNLPGQTLVADGRNALLVRNTNDAPLQVRLLTISKPGITNTYYALRGEIRYADVRGDGFLEMWNVFAPAQAGGQEMKFFSRTLGEWGEMGKISGSSDWRRFVLPFDWSGGASGSSRSKGPTLSPPTALEVNLILPGRGEVYLGPMELVEFPGGRGAVGSVAHAWWSDRQGGMVGGILGGVLGTLGGVIGWLASKGRARRFVVGASLASIAVGIVLLILGVAAVLMRQPYGVWSPLLLCGTLIVSILPGQLRIFRRTYEEQELRRMGAADAM